MNSRPLYEQVFKHVIDIRSIKKSANIINQAMNTIKQRLSPLQSTRLLAHIAETCLVENGADSGFKIFISPEKIVWHGIPDNKKLQEGQIVTVDIACSVNGWWADIAGTFPVGSIDTERTRLLNGAREGTIMAAQWIKDGCNGMQCTSNLLRLCVQRGLTLIKEANGHGLGWQLHKKPFISYTKTGHEVLTRGQVYTAEPVFTTGHGKISISKNGSAYTVDGLPSAHFELSVLAGDKHSYVLGEPDWFWDD